MNNEILKVILDSGNTLSRNTIDFLNYDTDVGSMVQERLGPEKARIACANLSKILASIGEEKLSSIYKEKMDKLEQKY